MIDTVVRIVVRARPRALALPCLVAIAACGGGDGGGGGDPWTALEGWPRYEEEAIRVTGLVDEKDVEGGVWVIQSPDGEEWAPIELPEAFRIDGAGVVADVRRRPDLWSIGMTGVLVEILRIRHGSVSGADGATRVGEGPAAMPTPSGSAPAWLVGEWRITEAHRPGINTGAAAAERWVGRTIQFGRTFAFGPNGECSEAVFEVRRSDTDALLSGSYGVPPESLPQVADSGEITLVEVRCNGASWDALGGSVLRVDGGPPLIPWDGAFFTLQAAG